MSNFPYAAIFILGALILPVLPRAWRSAAYLLFPAAGLYLFATGGIATEIPFTYAGYTLVLQRFDGLAQPFTLVFTIMLLIGGVFAYHVKETAQQVASLLYGGSAIGAVLAGDLVTLYLYWEVMALSSLYLIWAARTPESGHAGQRYVIVHVFGGSLLLAGIWQYATQTGSFAFDAFSGGGLSVWLILLGFSVNAGIPPLHAWLPDAYPRATLTGSVFLSAFTTKAAVYVLARGFPGWDVLIWGGIIMALYGVVFAVLENDIRRLLSYHIISQVGYMVAAIGLGTEVAINGAAAHAFAHVLYKSLLFMGVGIVIYATGTGKLTELGGLSRRLKLALALYMVGAVSISGFPLFSGFVSKSMVVAAFGAGALPLLSLVLNFASIGTFLHTGLKLPYFTWMGEAKRTHELRRVPTNMYVAMGIGALLSFLIGILPGSFYQILPHPVEYAPYTLAHLSESMQLLIGTALGFILLIHKLHGEQTLTLDTDWFYRRSTPVLMHRVVTPVATAFAKLDRAIEHALSAVVTFAESPAYGRRSGNIPFGVAAALLALVILILWGIIYTR